MHIIDAFKKAQKNRDEIADELRQWAMKLMDLNKKVMSILEPFTE